ncbi:hypothetical protein GQ457_04G011080 [Hibiscus cannabinus]
MSFSLLFVFEDLWVDYLDRSGFFAGGLVVSDGGVFIPSVLPPFLSFDLGLSDDGSKVLKVSSVKGFICLSLSFNSFGALGFHGLSFLDCLGSPYGPVVWSKMDGAGCSCWSLFSTCWFSHSIRELFRILVPVLLLGLLPLFHVLFSDFSSFMLFIFLFLLGFLPLFSLYV